MHERATNVKFISKPSLADTLRSLCVGRTIKIKNSQFKSNSVRNTISRLKKTGFDFKATEIGCVDEIRITRLK